MLNSEYGRKQGDTLATVGAVCRGVQLQRRAAYMRAGFEGACAEGAKRACNRVQP